MAGIMEEGVAVIMERRRARSGAGGGAASTHAGRNGFVGFDWPPKRRPVREGTRLSALAVFVLSIHLTLHSGPTKSSSPRAAFCRQLARSTRKRSCAFFSTAVFGPRMHAWLPPSLKSHDPSPARHAGKGSIACRACRSSCCCS